MAWTTQKTQAFTNSDGTLLTSHDGDFSYWALEPQIQSNALRGSGFFTTSYFRLSGITLADDQACEYKLAAADSSRFHAGCLRIGTIGAGEDFDCYQAFCTATTTALRRYDYDGDGSPVVTAIDTDTVVIAAGDTLRIEAVGTGLEVFKNGTSILSGSDSTFSGGEAGGYLYYGSGLSCRIDDLVIEDDAGGAAATGIFAGALSLAAELAGKGAGRGELAGALVLAAELAGKGAGRGELAGALALAAELAGKGAGRGELAGALALAAQLEGANVNAAAFAGALSLAAELAGKGAGAGQLAGAIALGAQLAGSNINQAAFAGALALAAELAGKGAGRGELAGALALAAQLEGANVNPAAFAGALSLAAELAGKGAGSGRLVAALELGAALAGAPSGGGSFVAGLSLAAELAGKGGGLGTVAGALALSGAFRGVSRAAGAFAAGLVLSGALAGKGAGAGTLAAALVLAGDMAGTTNGGIGELAGALSLAAELGGKGAGVGQLAAAALLSGALRGTVDVPQTGVFRVFEADAAAMIDADGSTMVLTTESGPHSIKGFWRGVAMRNGQQTGPWVVTATELLPADFRTGSTITYNGSVHVVSHREDTGHNVTRLALFSRDSDW